MKPWSIYGVSAVSSRFCLLFWNVIVILCNLAGADPTDPYRTTGATRNLGLIVARGPTVMLVCPEDGMEEIANPFQE